MILKQGVEQLRVQLPGGVFNEHNIKKDIIMRDFKKINIGALVMVCLFVLRPNNLGAKEEINFQISSKKSIYSLGEPIVIEAKIINFSSGTITIDSLRFITYLSIRKFEINDEGAITGVSGQIYNDYFDDISEEERYKNRYIHLRKNEFFGRFIDYSKEIKKPGDYEFYMRYEGPITKDIEIEGVKISGGNYIVLNSNSLIIKIVDK